MKHLKWLGLLLAFGVILAGCGENNEETLTQPPAESIAYVVNQLSMTISTVNVTSGQVQKDVYTVGNAPNDIHYRDGRLYIVNTMDNNLQILDSATGQSEWIDLGEGSSPEKMAFVSETKVYVTAGMADSVKVVDLISKSVVQEIPVGVAPWGIAIHQGKAYVVNSNYDFANSAAREGSVSVIDLTTGTVETTIPVGVNPQEIAIAPDGKLLVVCTGNYADVLGSVVTIDPTTNAASAPVDLDAIPAGIVVRPDGKAYITYSNFATGESGLLVLDTASGTLTHSTADPLLPGTAGMGMAVDSQNRLYVAVPNWDGSAPDKLLVLDEADQVVGTYEVGDGGGAASFIALRE